MAVENLSTRCSWQVNFLQPWFLEL
jgi:hypothetical protein